MGAPECLDERVAFERVVTGMLDRIQCIGCLVFTDEAAAPCRAMCEFAHVHPFSGDDGVLHLPEIVADHVVKDAQHDADPAHVIAEQCSQ
ncbi:hypothetical protein CA260_10425 [Dyella jiangningensis]|uniref:Uncharacterized protein n=1 Tax=Dyella jiangningensis TaxID=1379159 RepID=A0A328P7Y9_9GAMM|nr:hypothetical protein CA260_10425 [Dyella jiangningensis]